MSDVLSATTPPNDSSPADTAGTGYSFSKILRIGGFILVIAALIAVTGSFAILMGFTSVSPTDEVVGIIVLVVGTLLFALFLAICWEVWTLIKARRRGRAASRLHIRIVSLFAIVAAVPALVVAIVAGITLDLGLDRWFSSRTQSIVESSVSVAQSYLSEHARFLASDMRAIARDFDRQRAAMETDQRAREVFLTTQATIRSLPGLSLVDKEGKEIAKANIRVRRDFPEVPQGAIRDAGRNQNGIPILIRPGKSGNLVGGVLSLNTFDDYYLYAIRTVDPKVVRYLQDAESNAAEYANLRGGRSGVQVAFALLYAGLALVLLVSAIWVAIAFANRLVNPIRRLIAASDQVAGGDLTTNVPVKKSDGDIGSLSQTFNTMVSGLKNQQEELISTNAQLDQRRRFTEAVLSGVTAGVLGLTSDGEIEIANSYVEAVLGTKSDALLGRRLQEAIPEFDELLENAMNEIKREHQGQIALIRGGQERIINVRITAELDGVQAEGYVVTLDDITDLVNAQRSSAWADVARRIAHEIRNPLTPIQLSAERLRRRFGKDLNEKDQAVFDKCTDTIVRQVGDIGRMVDEFSSFARMPKATLAPGDLRECIREAVYLREVASPSTSFKLELSEEPMRGDYDERLISQAVGNLIKNASEALEESGLPDAEILVKARSENELLMVEIIDNGPGWPKENRNKLLEPYMTTRKKGTGLGLAIVTKVIEEHLGRVELLDAPDYEQTQRGAMVRIVLPAKPNKDDIVEEDIIQEEKESIRS